MSKRVDIHQEFTLITYFSHRKTTEKVSSLILLPKLIEKSVYIKCGGLRLLLKNLEVLFNPRKYSCQHSITNYIWFPANLEKQEQNL